MSPSATDTARAAEDLAEHGFAVVPDVLDAADSRELDARLWAARDTLEARGVSTYVPQLDPNSGNIRLFNLVGLDPYFGELLHHPVADAIVGRYLGDDYIVSNISANIARPGSGSMAVHSDQALVHHGPWTEPWAVNVIWCPVAVRGENGATRYVPGSHRFTRRDELPGDLEARLVPFEAPAGSVIVMDGRVWHTSGANTTEDEDRPLVFAYYTRPFVRAQWNFTASLPAATQAAFSPMMRYRMGLDTVLNKPPAAEWQVNR